MERKGTEGQLGCIGKITYRTRAGLRVAVH